MHALDLKCLSISCLEAHSQGEALTVQPQGPLICKKGHESKLQTMTFPDQNEVHAQGRGTPLT